MHPFSCPGWPLGFRVGLGPDHPLPAGRSPSLCLAPLCLFLPRSPSSPGEVQAQVPGSVLWVPRVRVSGAWRSGHLSSAAGPGGQSDL